MIIRLHLLFFLLHPLFYFFTFSSSDPVRTISHDRGRDTGIVGVTYKPNTHDIPEPNAVAKHLVMAGIPMVRLIDPDVGSISAFEHLNIDLSLSLENIDLIGALASHGSEAISYLKKNVVPSLPNVKISSISVGYGILTSSPAKSKLLLPAIVNVHNAFRFLKIKNISITTGHSFDAIVNPVPPSSAEFNSSFALTMKHLLDFTAAVGAPFQISLFPFNLYRKTHIPGVTVTFIKFEAREDQFYTDPVTQAKYRNLYDMMLDAAIVALAKMGHSTMPILVTGTGWPSSGEKETAPEATFLNAAEYNQRLVIIMNMKNGTPLRRKVTPVTYIHGLFDEKKDVKDKNSYDNSWGIWDTDLSEKYTIKFQPDHSNDRLRDSGATPVFCFCAAMVACLALVVRNGK